MLTEFQKYLEWKKIKKVDVEVQVYEAELHQPSSISLNPNLEPKLENMGKFNPTKIN